MTKEKEAVKSMIHQFFKAMDEQDLAAMSRITAHDANMVHIGTDAEEYWVGWQHLKEETIRMFEGMRSYKTNIQNLRVSLSQTKEVAWFSFILDTDMQTAHGKVRIQSGRYSGVMEKRNNHWKLVQTHLSLP